MSYAVKIVR